MRSCPPKHGTYAISEHTGTCVTFLLELSLGKGVRNPNDGSITLVRVQNHSIFHFLAALPYLHKRGNKPYTKGVHLLPV